MDLWMLDSCIYGRIVIDDDRELIHDKVHAKNYLIYGFEIIRKELRSTDRIIDGISLKVDLLRVYDDFVKKTYRLEEGMKSLANDYYAAYQNLGGGLPKEHLINDFLIIACASIKNLGIVVSDDRKTMLSELALKAYKSVNESKKIPFPEFKSYLEFKNGLKK